MNICLVTTTITVPHVLAKYRAIGPSIDIIVAGDVSGPQHEIAAFCEGIDARYLSYEEQGQRGYAVHEIIGQRTIQRRNIALLEAMRSGADIIVTVDTDNEPEMVSHIRMLRDRFTRTFSGYGWRSPSGWLNPGTFADEPHVARGFPLSLRHDTATYECDHAAGVVGIAQSLVLGDPDIDAIERIAKRPTVTGYRLNGGSGWVTSPNRTWAPFNSQATAYRRELAPLSACMPGVGRYDDIWGSFVAQRVMMATDYLVYFGHPFVRQERHEHNLLSDLKAELYGMEHTERFCELLLQAPVSEDATVLENLASVYGFLADEATFLPEQATRFMAAWLTDVEAVL